MSIVLISLALCLFVSVIPSCTYIVHSADTNNKTNGFLLHRRGDAKSPIGKEKTIKVHKRAIRS